MSVAFIACAARVRAVSALLQPGRLSESRERRTAARRRLAAAAVALLALVGSCEHAQPFGPVDLGPNVPYAIGFPRRLTFNDLGDIEPAWFPNGSALIYSFGSGEVDDAVCLGVLPAEGGHQVQTICHRLPAGTDSTIDLRMAAVGRDGQLAYLRESSANGSEVPDRIELVVATLEAPDPGRVLLRFPYTSSDGVLHGGLGALCWVSDTSLMYIGEQVTYTFPPLPLDTIYTPLRIERLTIAGDSARVEVVPGTASATGLTVDSSGALYYTLAGDSRVFRLAAGASGPTTVYDFGAAGDASDVQVAGHELVALAGGSLYAVNMASGSLSPIDAPGSVVAGRMALAPSAQRVVVALTQAGSLPDLWLLQVP